MLVSSIFLPGGTVGLSQDVGSRDCASSSPVSVPEEAASLVAPRPVPIPKPEWIELFDQKSLKNWKSTDFGGQGDVELKDGHILMDLGAYMTGITYQGELAIPKTNYEISLKASRVDGNDFFSGLTFPVQESFCSLILGGWGGGVCGLSSIDSMDASENDTTSFRLFEKGEWYQIRLMVLDDRILAWIDGERVIDQEITDKEISIRPEVELCCPLGLATYQTAGAIESFKIRELSEPELKSWRQAE